MHPSAYSFIYNLPMGRAQGAPPPTSAQQRIGAGMACVHLMLCDRDSKPLFVAPPERRPLWAGTVGFEPMTPVDGAATQTAAADSADQPPAGSGSGVRLLLWVWVRGPLDTEALCQRVMQSLNQAVAEYAMEMHYLRLVRSPPAPELTRMLARAATSRRRLCARRTGVRLPRWMLPHLAQGYVVCCLCI